jgi:hypothetical protein
MGSGLSLSLYAESPRNSLINDYTEIFYLIYNGNVASIQCKMNLNRLKFLGFFCVCVLSSGCSHSDVLEGVRKWIHVQADGNGR